MAGINKEARGDYSTDSESTEVGTLASGTEKQAEGATKALQAQGYSVQAAPRKYSSDVANTVSDVGASVVTAVAAAAAGPIGAGLIAGAKYGGQIADAASHDDDTTSAQRRALGLSGNTGGAIPPNWQETAANSRPGGLDLQRDWAPPTRPGGKPTFVPGMAGSGKKTPAGSTTYNIPSRPTIVTGAGAGSSAPSPLPNAGAPLTQGGGGNPQPGGGVPAPSSGKSNSVMVLVLLAAAALLLSKK